MRTKTLRGLAAGAGATAIMFAGAATSFAGEVEPGDPGEGPKAAEYEAKLVAEGYTDVFCDAQPIQEPQNEVRIPADYADLLDEGESFLLLVVKVANEYTEYPMPEYEKAYAGSNKGGGNVTHTILCQGVGAPGDDDDQTDAPGDDDDKTEAPGDDDDKTESPTGPPVETDGPASESGPNMGLIGGAALAVVGAGAAGFAMRRRPEGR